METSTIGCSRPRKWAVENWLSNKKWKLLWATSFNLRLAQVKKNTVLGCRQGGTLPISQQMMA